jgi:hypothetical protein
MFKDMQGRPSGRATTDCESADSVKKAAFSNDLFAIFMS